MILLLLDEILYEVADEQNSLELWLKLEKKPFMTKSISKKLLKIILFGLCMKEGVCHWRLILTSLILFLWIRVISIEVEDKYAVMILLASLLSFYEGVDYNEFFSLIVKHNPSCLTCSTRYARHGLGATWCENNFLHGQLEEEILTKQPKARRQGRLCASYKGHCLSCNNLLDNGTKDSINLLFLRCPRKVLMFIYMFIIRWRMTWSTWYCM